jgi:cytochrome b561
MNSISLRQIARRAVLAPHASYRSGANEGAARSQTTRVLHVLLLLAVLHQLTNSEVINRPLPGDAPSTLFLLHEYVGMASLAVVCVFWLWTLVRRGETSAAKLFPWLSPRRIKAIVADGVDQFQALRRGDFADDGSGAIASAVHGLGLLTITAMAATGTVLFFASGSVFHYAMSLHRVIANVMWIYLIGHAAAVVAHHLLGSDILRRMFWIRSGTTIATRQPIHEDLPLKRRSFSRGA